MEASQEPRPFFSIVIPVFNEQESLPRFLELIRSFVQSSDLSCEWLFVDDGSMDGSAALLARAGEEFSAQGLRCKVLRHSRNQGMGAAVLTGFAAAQGEWLTLLPSDGQIEPFVLDKLAKACREGADLVLTDYAQQERSLHRRLLSAGFAFSVSVLLGNPCQYKGIYTLRRSDLVKPSASQGSFFLHYEILASAASRYPQPKISRLEIACLPRIAGKSKVLGAKAMLRLLADMAKWRWKRGKA